MLRSLLMNLTVKRSSGVACKRAEEVHGLGIEPAIPDEAVAARVAGEQRALEIADLLAGGEIIVEIAEAAAVDAVFDAVDRAARPGAEIERAAGRVIAVERRRRPPDDVDGAIGARIDQVAARQAVRLRHRKAVVEDHEVADAEAVAGVGAANRDAEIARAVALLDRYAGAVAQHVGRPKTTAGCRTGCDRSWSRSGRSAPGTELARASLGVTRAALRRRAGAAVTTVASPASGPTNERSRLRAAGRVSHVRAAHRPSPRGNVGCGALRSTARG